MKVIISLASIVFATNALAFDFKGLVEKAAKDKKMQEQAKDIAKKGYEYFKGDKAEKKSEDVATTKLKDDKAATKRN